MFPVNTGRRATYQDIFAYESLKFYPDPFTLPRSTQDYIVQF